MILELQAKLDSNFNKTFQQSTKRIDDMENALKEITKNNGPKKSTRGVHELGDAFGRAKREAGSFQDVVVRVWKYTGAYALTKAIVNGFTSAIAKVGEYDDALHNLQARTGASAAEMEGISEIADELYSAGYGADFSNLTQSLAEVKQITQLSGDALRGVSSDAFAFSEAFGYDVKESIRTAMNMSRNFGITTNEAFNLMSQGVQRGLDSNGDMLDTFNEYSVYYKQLGFESAQFLDTLDAGMKAGARNTDVIADGVKEIGIMSKDGSKKTIGALKALGFNAERTMEDIARGGSKAQVAYQKVVKAIEKVEDPFRKNELAVELFGTKAEDLEVTVINALANVERSFDKTKNTMEEIKKVNYSSVQKGIKGIGRQFQIAVLKPVQEKVIPILERVSEFFNSEAGKAWFDSVTEGVSEGIDKALEFAGFIQNNWQTIKTITLSLAGAMVALKVGLLGLQVVTTITTLLTAYRNGTLLAQLATLGFNAALWANPATWVVAGIAALIGITVALVLNWDKVKVATLAVWDVIKDNPLAWIVGGPITAFIGAAATIIKNWNPTEKFFANMWNGIKIAFSDSINFIIDKVNWLIGKMNKIKLPDWLGGGGVNIPTIDHVKFGQKKLTALPETSGDMGAYADGTITSGPEIAMIGEGADDESVIPHNRKPRSIGLLGATMKKMGLAPTNSGGGGGDTIHVQFSPQIVLQGSATEADARRVADASQAAFEKGWDKMNKQRKRVSLAYEG